MTVMSTNIRLLSGLLCDLKGHASNSGLCLFQLCLNCNLHN